MKTAAPPAPIFQHQGFTLIELAIVLFIVALLLGGMLMPLSAQQDIRYQTDTQKQLADIQEALLGYAASHQAADGKPYLPCPDTDNDGRENRTGNACTNQDGILPWGDLGIGRQDAWSNAFHYRVTAAFSSNAAGFVLTSAGDMRICDRANCSGTILATQIPAVLFSRGKNGAAVPTDVDELENLDADTDFVQHPITSSGYDDQVVWISSNILFNRMLSAGRLP
ncbi:MAG: prepilin-type N-terminal cleavage/methylation domain-containing protein [Rugosibacter sp.]|nr:prepilin-type N-terminal cleavage/methylation domain-containing protein [Rugosibacter sp.]